VTELSHPRWLPWLCAISLGVLATTVFLPIRTYEFVDYDVPMQVINNPHIRGLTAENLKHIFTSRSIASYYPVRSLSYAANYEMCELDPAGFKLTNLAIHVTNTLLVFWLMLRLFRRANGNATPSVPQRAVLTAAFSAGIFAIHPLVVEPVTWVPGREELLMALGALGCFHLHLTARRLERTGSHRSGAVAAYAGSACCCAFAVLSNAVGAVIPFLVVAWDALTLQRPRLGRIASGTSALWLISGASIVIKKLGTAADMTDVPSLFSGEWMMFVPKMYWHNVKAVFWPVDLAVHYEYPFPKNPLDTDVWLGVLAAGLTALAVWLARRRIMLCFGLLWFVLALAPTSQLMPHHVARADRFLYLPLIGLTVALAYGLKLLGDIARNRQTGAAMSAAGVLVLLTLAAVSSKQIPIWRNSLSLWENCLKVDPSNSGAHASLAQNLTKQGQFEQAIEHYEVSLRGRPDAFHVMGDFAWSLAVRGDPRHGDFQRALQLAERACEITDWQEPTALNKLSTVHGIIADCLAAQAQFDQAVYHYRKALEADPAHDAPLFNLALLLATCEDRRIRQPAQAVQLAEEGCRSVGKPDAYRLTILAAAYAAADRFDEAVRTVETAIRLARAEGDADMVEALQHHLETYRNRTTLDASQP